MSERLVLSYPQVSEERARNYLMSRRRDVPDLFSEGFWKLDTRGMQREVENLIGSRRFSGSLGSFDLMALKVMEGMLANSFLRTDGKLKYLILPICANDLKDNFDEVYKLVMRGIELLSMKMSEFQKIVTIVMMMDEVEEIRSRRPQEVIGKLSYNASLAEACGLSEEEVRSIRCEDMEELRADFKVMEEDLRRDGDAESADLIAILFENIYSYGTYRSFEGCRYVMIFTRHFHLERLRESLFQAVSIYRGNYARLGLKQLLFTIF